MVRMDKILRINVAAAGGPQTSVEPLGRYEKLGGRAMTTTILWEEVNPTCDPFGGENKIILAPGVMSGSVATTSGRLSIGFKSPMTGGIKEANAGGQASQYLARLGYAAVVLEGERQGDDLYKIVINSEGASLVKCNELKKLGNYAVAEKIKDEHGDNVALICVGIAGELGMINSSIAVTDPEFRPTRHAARGGGGSVMGSKGIKAIVVDGKSAPMRQPLDKEAFTAANKKLIKAMQSSDYTGQSLPAFGSASIAETINEMGAYPALGAKQGSWDGVAKISGPTLAELEKKRGASPTHGCHTGCMIRCSGIFNNEKGEYVTKQPEYETLWSHGGFCGIDDLDVIAKLDFLDDDIGLDTIDMGVTIGMLMEAGEIAWGDGEAAIAVVEEIRTGSEKGMLYGSGAALVAKHFGVKRAPVIKGQAMAAYDPRGMKGLGVTYATSPMGADHSAGHTLPNHLKVAEPNVEALATDKQWLASSVAQIGCTAFDTTGYCLFVSFGSLDKPEVVKFLLDSVTAFTGDAWNETSFAALGIRVLRMERDFNMRAGFTAEDDRLPEWMTKEPLPPHNHVFDVSNDDLDQVHNHAAAILAMYEGVIMAFAPPMSLMGEGVHRLVPDNLVALGVSKALIVTDQGVTSAGLLKLLTDVFDAKHMPYAVYNDTEPNPTTENVDAAMEIYIAEKCNGLVSLGGGSPHDCAKVVGILANHPGKACDYEGLFGLTKMLPPMIAITTTSGTGSEVSFGAVVSDTKRHAKMVMADPKLVPIIAVNDPIMTRTMPPHITAGTGMDALTHAVEAYTSAMANPYTDGLCLQAIKLIFNALPKAVENGDDMEARMDMCYGQYCAGLAMNSAQLGSVHSLAHSLGAHYNLPHGDCNAMMLPHGLKKTKAVQIDKFVSMAQTMGIDIQSCSKEEAADKAIAAIETLMGKINIATTITELLKRCHMPEASSSDIPALVDHAMADPCNGASPVAFSRQDFQEIYERVWG
jgi:aldehyde:ferredoxin oxidoreductase